MSSSSSSSLLSSSLRPPGLEAAVRRLRLPPMQHPTPEWAVEAIRLAAVDGDRWSALLTQLVGSASADDLRQPWDTVHRALSLHAASLQGGKSVLGPWRFAARRLLHAVLDAMLPPPPAAAGRAAEEAHRAWAVALVQSCMEPCRADPPEHIAPLVHALMLAVWHEVLPPQCGWR